MIPNNEILIVVPTATNPASFVIYVSKDSDGDYVMNSMKLKDWAHGIKIDGDLRDPNYIQKYFDGYDICALGYYSELIQAIDQFFQEHVVWRDVTSGA